MFLVQILVSFLIRFLFKRKTAPWRWQAWAFSQDVSVAALLSLLPFGTLLEVLLPFYLLCDAFLYKQMQLRMRPRYVSYLWQSREWLISARKMGLGQLGLWALALALLEGMCVPLYRFQGNFALCAVASFIAAISLWIIPKSLQYAVNHPFFLWHPKRKEGGILRKGKSGERTLPIRVAPEEKPHVIFLFLESFPAKYVDSLPQWNRLKKEGLFFPQFYANGTLTYRALLSGVFGVPAGNTAVGLSPYMPFSFQGVPALLKGQGYRTAFHHNGSLRFDRQDRFLAPHFDEQKDQRDIGGPQRGWAVADHLLMEYSADWLSKQTAPSFLTMFTLSNHHPWVVPDGYQAPPGHPFSQTLHYSDHTLGLFIDRLREKNLSQKSILFILGDHGQPMGEHQGNFYNSRFLYEENVHVPLLILADGRLEPQVIEEIGSQIDLLPTVADLLHLKMPCLGTSLLRSTPKIAFFQNPYSEGFWGCREGNWKWIQNQFSGEEELYLLTEDPEERRNVQALHPKITTELREKTTSFFAGIETVYAGKRGDPASLFCLDLSHSLITDAELEKHLTPELCRVNLEQCLLLTDRGIEALCKRCPFLEELNLAGLSDLTDAAFPHEFPELFKLDVSAAPTLSAEHVVKQCPRLRELSINMRGKTELPIKNLTRLKLFEAELISEEAIEVLVEQNPHLGRLDMNGIGPLTERMFAALKTLPLERLLVDGYSVSFLNLTAYKFIDG